MIFQIVGGSDLTLAEVSCAADLIYGSVAPDANIIFGAVVNPNITNGQVCMCNQ